MAWREFNSLPSTPPPLLNADDTTPPVPPPTVLHRTVRRPRVIAQVGALVVLAAALAVGVAAGILVFHPARTPRSNTTSPVPRTPTTTVTKLEEAVRPKPVVAPITPAAPPRPPEQAEVILQPAEAPPVVERHQTAPRVRPPLKKAAGSAQDGYRDGYDDSRRDGDLKVKSADVPRPQVGLQSGDTKLTPAPPTVEEFGMTLHAPLRPPSKKIDETDPYVP